MKKIIILILVGSFSSCGSVHIAKDIKMMSFEEKVNEANLKNVGNIKAKDCTWSLFGWQLGEEPNVRTAFANAVALKKDNLNPLEKSEVSDQPLKVLKNANVETSGFGVWIVGRQCINVTGIGLK